MGGEINWKYTYLFCSWISQNHQTVFSFIYIYFSWKQRVEGSWKHEASTSTLDSCRKWEPPLTSSPLIGDFRSRDTHVEWLCATLIASLLATRCFSRGMPTAQQRGRGGWVNTRLCDMQYYTVAWFHCGSRQSGTDEQQMNLYQSQTVFPRKTTTSVDCSNAYDTVFVSLTLCSLWLCELCPLSVRVEAVQHCYRATAPHRRRSSWLDA